jgi:hypothetical protein
MKYLRAPSWGLFLFTPVPELNLSLENIVEHDKLLLK